MNMKMTFQPKKRQRSKVHGFRARMSSAGGRRSLAAKEQKEEKNYQLKTADMSVFLSCDKG